MTDEWRNRLAARSANMLNAPYGYTAETAPAALAPIYGMLAPDPKADYGSMLPFARDRETGERRWAMPQMVRDGLLGVVDALAGTETGQLTGRATGSVTIGGIGTAAALGPVNALASGGARRSATSALDMTEAARLQRARKMGFDVDVPLYHGTDAPADFRAFSLDRSGAHTGSPPAGVWAAEDRRYPNQLLAIRDASGTGQGGNPRVMPLYGRPGKVGEITTTGKEERHEIMATIANAFDNGYDSVRLTQEGGMPGATWVFKDPNQLRSRFAAFDPAKRDSADLLAGVVAPSPIAPPSFGSIGPAGQPLTPEEARKALARHLADREY